MRPPAVDERTTKRKITYLRVSVTDHCNYRCAYCMPGGAPENLPRSEILSYEEIIAVVRAGAEFGITKVRVTGGEPLVRKDVVELVRRIREVDGLREVCMTTNGSLLARHARPLREAGLDRLNVSMDSLMPDRFRRITGGGELSHVLAGLNAAENAGFGNIKVNVVLMRGVNCDELPQFVHFAAARGLEVRFIEKMPLNQSVEDSAPFFVGLDEIRRRLHNLHALERLEVEPGAPAQLRYRLIGTRGVVGVIAPISKPFCSECNRLRLSADGKLHACLMEDGHVDVKSVIRTSGTEAELLEAFKQAAALKPPCHNGHSSTLMSRIGG